MERNVVHEKKGLFVASGRGFRRGFFEKRLFENANGLEEPIWKNLPRVFLCECLLIRVSRVRTPDRALENRCFCRHWSCGDGGFLRVAMRSAENKKKGPREVLAFPWDLSSYFPCGECRDRDGAERNRGALLIAAVLTCLHKFLYLSRDDLHQPLPRFDRCPGDVRCDEKPVLIFYI